jgi:hypothetical protein
MTFPVGDYTPFGYLANPYHRARSYADVEAGLLRSTDDVVGFGWVEPTARKPALDVSFAIALRWKGRTYQVRPDFARLGYRSVHHSSLLFTYDWELDAVRGIFAVALAGRDELVGRISLQNAGTLPHECDVIVVARAWSRDGRWTVEYFGRSWRLAEVVTDRTFDFSLSGTPARSLAGAELSALAPALALDDRAVAGFMFEARLKAEETVEVGLGLQRGATSQPSGLAERAIQTCVDKRRDDDDFYAGVALPVGDWPDSWKRGWIYDLETTRACIFPAGGVFRDEWPSWMMPWPRVVLAEGSLDATRFSYASPARALGLLATIFRDAPAANIPCVFQGGEPNMVAKDGSVCGTSPAWCLPFHNVKLLYYRTLDRDWLRQILPGLVAYLQFWLDDRTDEEGWAVYKCTWEAGEDCTPRLDPAGEGDEVVSRYVRPVELQATMSYSARVVAELASEVGDAATEERWTGVATDFARRTAELWDDEAGRFRDWDKRTGAFLTAPGETTYWKTDPIRFSPLSLTPLVAGIATSNQIDRLRKEIRYYDAAPWCYWPSWSYVIAEAATTSGWHGIAGEFAARIVDRVYRSNDRRTLSDSPRPTPGTSPEFWPLDLAEFDGSDGYGWGATTTSLWMRQVFGFLDDYSSNECAFLLAPNLPATWLKVGRTFGMTRLPYRGRRLDIRYDVSDVGLFATVQVHDGQVSSVRDDRGHEVDLTLDRAAGAARFAVALNRAARVVLDDA